MNECQVYPPGYQRKERHFREEMDNSSQTVVTAWSTTWRKWFWSCIWGHSGLWLINHVCQGTGKSPAKKGFDISAIENSHYPVGNSPELWNDHSLSPFSLLPPYSPTFHLSSGHWRLCVALHRPSEALCFFLWAGLCTCFHQHNFSYLTPALRGDQNELNQSTNHPRMSRLDSWLCFPPQEHLQLNLPWGCGVCACLWYRAG